jgi:GNAT superfamily N-acetyltransferase
MYSIRKANGMDAAKIAELHALSWLSTYRGILPDSYLDNDLFAERNSYWVHKLKTLTENDFVLLAEEGAIAIGFIAVLDRPEAGCDAFIDNLHVRKEFKGKGIGRALMKEGARLLRESKRNSAYLWVLDGNTAAGRFYLSRGAEISDTSVAKFGGKEVQQTRYVWNDLTSLLID